MKMKKMNLARAILLCILVINTTVQAKEPLAETSKNNTPLKRVMIEQEELVKQAKSKNPAKKAIITYRESKTIPPEQQQTTPGQEVNGQQAAPIGQIIPNIEKQGFRATSHYGKDNPAPLHSILTWTPYDMAVCYEFQLWAGYNQVKPSGQPVEPLLLFTTANIYTNAYDINLSPYVNTGNLAWRVRALNIDKQPISDYSLYEPLFIDANKDGINYPMPLSDYDISKSNGSVLLYPVYSFVPVPGAAKYEVELTNSEPENPMGTVPSQYRIWSKTFTLSTIYDDYPRMGPTPFFWRVRAFAADNSQIGTYSPAKHFLTDPSVGWQVGVLGDSISHGGGDMSYSPSNFVYSWVHYLQFPAINLSDSGDTSTSMVARFEEDALPFHPHYLLIMGGTNSLRAGTKAEDVIEDLKELKEKCLANNIKPIFLTLLPINPGNIYRCFKENTAENWQEKFAAVNAYIRSQVHVDVAAVMPFGPELLPTNMGIDGLHPTAEVKRIIGETVSAQWPKVTQEADAE